MDRVGFALNLADYGNQFLPDGWRLSYNGPPFTEYSYGISYIIDARTKLYEMVIVNDIVNMPDKQVREKCFKVHLDIAIEHLSAILALEGAGCLKSLS